MSDLNNNLDNQSSIEEEIITPGVTGNEKKDQAYTLDDVKSQQPVEQKGYTLSDLSNTKAIETGQVQEKINLSQVADIKRKSQFHANMEKEFVYDEAAEYSRAEQRWIHDAEKYGSDEEVEEGMSVFRESNQGITGKLYYFDPNTMMPSLLKEGEKPPVDLHTGMASDMYGANGIDRFISGFSNGAIAGAGVGTWFGGIPGAALGALGGGLSLGMINAFAEDQDYITMRDGNTLTDDRTITTMAKTFNNTLLSTTTGIAALLKIGSEGLIGNETVFSQLYEDIGNKNDASQMQTNPLVPSDFQSEKAWESTAEFFNGENYDLDAMPVMIAQGLASAMQFIGAGSALKATGAAAGKLAARKSSKLAAKYARINKIRQEANLFAKAGNTKKATELMAQASKIGNESMKSKAIQFAAGMTINNQEIMQQLEEVEGLTIRDKAAYAMLATMGMSAIEMIGGPDALLLRRMLAKNGITDGIKSEVVDEIKKYSGKRLTGKALKKVHDKAYYGGMKKVGVFAKELLWNGGFSEGLEELGQSVFQDGAANFANYVYELDDETGFNADMASPETWTGYFNSFVAGFTVGGTMNASAAAKASRITGSIGMAKIVGDDGKLSAYEANLKILHKNKNISDVEYQNAKENLLVFKSFDDQLKEYPSITGGQKKDLFVNMFERHELERKKVELGKNADTKIIDNQIKEYDVKINDILSKAGEINEKKKKAGEKRDKKATEKMAKDAKEEEEEEFTEDAEWTEVKDEKTKGSKFDPKKQKPGETPEEAEARNSKESQEGETPEEAEARNAKDNESNEPKFEMKSGVNDETFAPEKGSKPQKTKSKEALDKERDTKIKKIDDHLEKQLKKDNVDDVVTVGSAETYGEKAKKEAATMAKIAKLNYRDELRKSETNKANITKSSLTNALDIWKSWTNNEAKESKGRPAEVQEALDLINEAGKKGLIKKTKDSGQGKTSKNKKASDRDGEQDNTGNAVDPNSKGDTEKIAQKFAETSTEGDTIRNEIVGDLLEKQKQSGKKEYTKKDGTTGFYSIDNETGKKLTGVTRFINSLKGKFKSFEQAEKMVRDEISTIDKDKGESAVLDEDTPAIKTLLKKWAYRTQIGTDLHFLAEAAIKDFSSARRGRDLPKDSKGNYEWRNELYNEFKVFIDNKKKKGKTLMAEFELVDPDTGLIMIIDLLEVNPDGSLTIYDFKVKASDKTSPEKFRENASNENYLETSPIKDLEQTAARDYAIQMKSARRALERLGYIVNDTRVIPIAADLIVDFRTNPTTGEDEYSYELTYLKLKEDFSLDEDVTQEEMDALEAKLFSDEKVDPSQIKKGNNKIEEVTARIKEKKAKAAKIKSSSNFSESEEEVESGILSSFVQLNRIAQGDSYLSPIAQKLSVLAAKFNTKIVITEAESIKGSEGQTSVKFDEIKKEYLTSVALSAKLWRERRGEMNESKIPFVDEVIVHEEIHRYTELLISLMQGGFDSLLTAAEQEFYYTSSKLYEEYSQNPSSKFPQIINLNEFIAYGLTNPSFIAELKSRESQNESLYKRFVDAISKLIGGGKDMNSILQASFNEFIGIPSETRNYLAQDVNQYVPLSYSESYRQPGESVEDFVLRSKKIGTGKYGTTSYAVYPGNVIVKANGKEEAYLNNQNIRQQILESAGLVSGKSNPQTKRGEKPSTAPKTFDIPPVGKREGVLAEPTNMILDPLRAGKPIEGTLRYNEKTETYSLERDKAFIKLGKKLYSQAADFKDQKVKFSLVPMSEWNPDGAITHPNGLPYGDKVQIIPSDSNSVIGNLEVNDGGTYVAVKKTKVEGENATAVEGNTGEAQARALSTPLTTVDRTDTDPYISDLLARLVGDDSPVDINGKEIQKRKESLEVLRKHRAVIESKSNYIENSYQRALLILGVNHIEERIQEKDSLKVAIKKARKLIAKKSKEQETPISANTIHIWEQSIYEGNRKGAISLWEDVYEEVENRIYEDGYVDTDNAYGNEDKKAARFKNSNKVRRLYASLEGQHPAYVYNQIYAYIHSIGMYDNNIDKMLVQMKALGGVLSDFVDNLEAKYEKSDFISLVNVVRSQKRRPHLALMINQGNENNKKSTFSVANESKEIELQLINLLNSRREALLTSGKQITDYQPIKGKQEPSEATLFGQYNAKKEELAKKIDYFNEHQTIENGVMSGTILDEDGFPKEITAKTLIQLTMALEIQYISSATGMEAQDLYGYLDSIGSSDEHDGYSNAAADLSSKYFYTNNKSKLILSKVNTTPIFNELFSFYEKKIGYRKIRSDEEFYMNAGKFVRNKLPSVFNSPGYSESYFNEEGSRKASTPLTSHVLKRADEAVSIPRNKYYLGNTVLDYYQKFKKSAIPTFIISGIKDVTAANGASGKNLSPEDMALINLTGFLDTKNDILNDGEYLQTLGQFADKSLQVFIPVKKLDEDGIIAEKELIRSSKNPDTKYFMSEAEMEIEIADMFGKIKNWTRTTVLGQEYREISDEKIQSIAESYVNNHVINSHYTNQIFFGRMDNYAGKPVPKRNDFESVEKYQEALEAFMDKARSNFSKRAGSMASGGLNLMIGIKGGLESTYKQAIYNDSDYKLEIKGVNSTNILLEMNFQNGDGIMFQSEEHEKKIQVSAGTAFDFKNSLKPLQAYVDDAANPILDKLHRITITKAMADENPNTLGPIYKAMQAGTIDTFVFETGAKLVEQYDIKGNPITVKNEVSYKDGKMINLDISKAIIVNRNSRSLRVQQNLNNAGVVAKKRIIPQMLRHLKKLVGSESYDKLLYEHLDQKTLDFKHQLRNMNEASKREFIIDALSEDDSSTDVLDMLQFGIPIENPVIKKYTFSTINNAIRKNVLDLNGKGALLTTISDIAFDIKLKGTRLSEDGKTVLPGEVLVPKDSGFNEKDEMFITRMPADDLHSVNRVIVVGFLPKEMGNKIVVSDVDRAMAGEDLDGDQRHVWVKSKDKYLDPKSAEAKQKLIDENIKRAQYNALKRLLGDEWKFYASNEDLFKNAPLFELDSSTKITNQFNNYEIKLGQHLKSFLDSVEDIEDYRSSDPVKGMYYANLRYLPKFINSPEAIVQELYNRAEIEYKKPENFERLTHPVDTNRLDNELGADQMSSKNHLGPSYNTNVFDANRSTTGNNSVIGVIAKSIATAIEITGNKIPLKFDGGFINHSKKQLNDIFVLFGDALNQATDNAKLMKLHRMGLNNENSSLYSALVLRGWGVSRIREYMEVPVVKEYFAAIRKKNMISDESIENNLSPLKILKEEVGKNYVEGEMDGRIFYTKEYTELESNLLMASELFQFGQLMNIAEKGIKNWPALESAKNSVEKFIDTGKRTAGEFKYILAQTTLPIYTIVKKAIETQNYSEEQFSVMETDEVGEFKNRLESIVGSRSFTSQTQNGAFERIVQRKIMETVFPSGKSPEILFAEIQAERQGMLFGENEFFGYTDITFINNKPQLGIITSVRHSGEEQILDAARKSFDKLPNSLQNLILEYNEKVYNSTYSLKYGAMTRIIGLPKHMEFGKKIRKVQEKGLEEALTLGDNLDDIAIILENHDFLQNFNNVNQAKSISNGYAIIGKAKDPQIVFVSKKQIVSKMKLSEMKEKLAKRQRILKVIPMSVSDQIVENSSAQPLSVQSIIPAAYELMEGTIEKTKIFQMAGKNDAMAVELLGKAARGEKFGKTDAGRINFNSNAMKFWTQAKRKSSGAKVISTSDYAKSDQVGNHKNFQAENATAKERNLMSHQAIRKSLLEYLASKGIAVDLETLTYDDLYSIFSIDGDPDWRDSQRNQNNLRGTWRDDIFNYFNGRSEESNQDGKTTPQNIMNNDQMTEYEGLKKEVETLQKFIQNFDPSGTGLDEKKKDLENAQNQILLLEKHYIKYISTPGAMILKDFKDRVMPQYTGVSVSSMPTAAREQLEAMYSGSRGEGKAKKIGYKEEWNTVNVKYFNVQFFNTKTGKRGTQKDGVLSSEQALIEYLDKSEKSNSAALEELISELKKEFKTVAAEFPLKILEDRLAKEQIIELVVLENQTSFKTRNIATRALYDILTITDNKSEDWQKNKFDSGTASLVSPSRVKESIMQLNESVIRERLRLIQIEEKDLDDRFKAINKEVRKSGADLKEITYQKENKQGDMIQYFIKADSDQMLALTEKAKQGNPSSKALLDFMKLHLGQEKKSGNYSWDVKEKAYRVPQVEADIFEILFGNMEGVSKKEMMSMLKDKRILQTFKSKLANKTSMDEFYINMKKANINFKKYEIDETSTFGEIKDAILLKMQPSGGIAAIKNNALAIKDLNTLKKYAEKLAGFGTDDLGAATSTSSLDKIKPKAGFVKSETTTTNIAAAVSRHHQGMIFKNQFEGIAPMMKYMEGHLKRTGVQNMAYWLELRNDEILFNKQPESALGKYEGMVSSIASFTYAKMLGLNYIGGAFNLMQGHTQTYRELGFKKMGKAYKRLSEQAFTSNPSNAFVANRAITLLMKFDIVNVSKDTELNISKKTQGIVSNALFFNIVGPEYLNHALSFIGEITDAEWDIITPFIDAQSTREELVMALGGLGNTTKSDLSEFTLEQRNQALKAGMLRLDALQEVTQRINGAYSKTAKRRISSTEEGRIFMMFKSWIPELLLAHKSVEFNDLYDYNRKGMADSGWDIVKTLKSKQGWKELAWTFAPGENNQERFTLLSEVDQGNVQKIIREALTIASLALAYGALFGDDDEELTSSQKKLRSMLQRALDESLFVYDPENYVKLTGAVPMATTLADMVKLTKQIFLLERYQSTNAYVEKGDLKMGHYVHKNIPYWNQTRSTFTTLMELTER